MATKPTSDWSGTNERGGKKENAFVVGIIIQMVDPFLVKAIVENASAGCFCYRHLLFGVQANS